MALVAGDWHRCPSSIRQQIWVTSGDPFKLIFGALFDSWFLFNRTLCDFSCLRSLKNGPLRFQPRLPGLETSFVLCFVQTNISRMQGSDAILDHVIGRAPVRVTSNLTRPKALGLQRSPAPQLLARSVAEDDCYRCRGLCAGSSAMHPWSCSNAMSGSFSV